jgi:hypothetical protein
MPKPIKPVAERFWNLVDVRSGPLCWLWKKPSKSRYPMFQLRTKQAVLANRMAYQITCGEIPTGMCVLHCCDNTQCVNPNHLELGTHLDNMRDCYRKGRRISVSQYRPTEAHKARIRELNSLRVGDANKLTKHPDALVAEIRRLHQTLSARQIAQQLNLSWNVVRNLLYHRR